MISFLGVGRLVEIHVMFPLRRRYLQAFHNELNSLWSRLKVLRFIYFRKNSANISSIRINLLIRATTEAG